MDMMFKEGATAFIIESNHIIREVKIVKRTGEFYIVRFFNGSGGIRIRASRLYETKEDADKIIARPETPKKHKYRSPYDYWH